MTIDIEDPASLECYLVGTGRMSGAAEMIGSTIMSGGVSNKTVLVRLGDGRSWVVKQALRQLRTAFDWFSDPARVLVESAALRRLATLAPPGSTPGLVFEDREHFIIAMEAVPQPHHNLKTLLMEGSIDQAVIHKLGALLGTIHRNGWEQRDTVAAEFADTRFFESLRIEPYYAFSAVEQPAAASFLRQLIEQTRARRITFTHGDFSPKNVLVRDVGQRLVLLDHEVAHFGDPAFDVGFCTTHFLSKAHKFPALRSLFAAAADQFWKSYCVLVDDLPWAGDLEPVCVKHTLACLLARVAGRSRLEYLDAIQQRQQADVVTALMRHAPPTMGALIQRFVVEIGKHEQN
jgi:5-methylthioribose kinase